MRQYHDFYFEDVKIIGTVSGTVVEIPLDPAVHLETDYEEGMTHYSPGGLSYRGADHVYLKSIDVTPLEDSKYMFTVTRVDAGPALEDFCDCGAHD